MKKIVSLVKGLHCCITSKMVCLRKKRLLLFLGGLIFTFSNSFALSTWDGISSNVWTNGDGSSTDPYLIENASNLVYLAQSVNNGTNYSGKSFKMTIDVDLNSELWTPIGKTSTNCFSGNFDGNGHTVSNLFINSSILQYAGLFGYVKNATISNIGIIGSWSITCKSSYSTSRYVGGITGFAYSSSFINCYNCQAISSTVNSSTFQDCYVGGIVGYASLSSLFVNCYNTGVIYGEAYSNITASSSNPLNNVNCAICYVGGIVGYISNSVNLTNCHNTGNIKGVTTSFGSGYYSDCRVGGLVGEANIASLISKCYNSGAITGTCNDNNECYVAGLVGCASDITLSDSYNEGAIIGKLTNVNGYSGGPSCFVSGILGYVHHSTATIKNCNNRGSLNSISSKFSGCLGGILGNVEYSASAVLSNCYNTATLSCTASASAYTTIWGIAGGLVGYISSTSDYIKIANSFNSGNITCSAPECNTGGIIGGILASTYITNCYDVGTISGSGTYRYVGALVGYINSSVSVTNSYLLDGSVSNATNTQGISKTSDYMKSVDFVTDLNNATLVWLQDINSINNGYPILTLLSVTSNSINIPAILNNTISVDITSNTTWTASSDQTWLTVSPSIATTGDATLTFTATANPTIATRTATVTVSATGATSQTITITQAAGDAMLLASTTTLNIAKDEGSTATANITSNTTWTASSDQTWLTVSPSIATTGDATLTFTATANPTIATRTATVTVSATGATSQTITIIQAKSTQTGVLAETREVFNLYPNPVTDVLYFSNVEVVKQIEFYNSNGLLTSVVKNNKSNSIDVSNFNTGVYLLRIITDEGVLVKKVIKQ